MRTVWKFELEPTAQRQPIEMPRGAKLLACSLDWEAMPCIWAEVDTEAPREVRMIGVLTTGADLEQATEYVGSFAVKPLILHVYEMAG